MPETSAVIFKNVAIIGIGLIGSSLARGLRRHEMALRITVGDINPFHCDKALGLGIADKATTDVAEAVEGADLVLLCTPIGAFAEIAARIAPSLAQGTIVSDVGSVKQSVIRDVMPHIPAGVHFIPGHPIAGTEFSGPEAGFAELFNGRWCLLTPPQGTDEQATAKVSAMWRKLGARVKEMEPSHHDKVLAVTSHLPHLIAYTIVGTATDLGESLESEIIQYSASGFHDFTRVAASDPIMWRDIFLNNREAVLEIIQRFTEDMVMLQRAIRWGDGEKLRDFFTKTRAIRRDIVEVRKKS